MADGNHKTVFSQLSSHGVCYLWDKQLLTLHVTSDSLIFLSYLAISGTLGWILYQIRRHISFSWISVAFGAFILACGLTHAMDVIVLWVPLYWLAGAIKLITAAASVITAIALPFTLPKMRSILEKSEASRRNELRLLGAAESSMDCLYFCDAARGATGEIEDFVFTYVNSNALKLVTIPANELIGARMGELFSINRRLGLIERYKQVVLTGESFVGEFAVEETNIRTEWLRIQAVKLEDGVAITASDISARKRDEEALHKSEAFLGRTERLAGVGGWEVNIQTQAVTWSAETYRIMGADPSWKPTLEQGLNFYIPSDQRVLTDALEKASAGEDGWDLELTINRLDGRQIPVRVAGAVEFVNGKPVRVSGTVQDKTVRAAERLALKRANERVTLATDSGRIGIWDWDVSRNQLVVNSWMFRLYGMEEQNNVTSYEPWKQRVHPDDLSNVIRALQDAIDCNRSVTDIEYRVLWDDGTLHHLRGSASATRDEHGHALRVVGTNWDVTEQHRLAEEADRLSKIDSQLKDDFLSHVSHELRSPLAAIDSFASIIADGLAGKTNPEQNEYLQIILRNSGQLQFMIEDLLQVTQARSGKLKVELERVSIPEVFVDVVHTLQGAAKAKEIQLFSLCAPHLPAAFGDPVRLRQVLIILCENAIKFTPIGGTVKAEARLFEKAPGFVLVEVSDTGCGISPTELDRVFEHLYQVADQSQAGRKGLGLGLHIAKDLVLRQGGEIWASSERQKGSVFHFTVPVFDCAADNIDGAQEDLSKLSEKFSSWDAPWVGPTSRSVVESWPNTAAAPAETQSKLS